MASSHQPIWALPVKAVYQSLDSSNSHYENGGFHSPYSTRIMELSANQENAEIQ
jgi:hypothetical protein